MRKSLSQKGIYSSKTSKAKKKTQLITMPKTKINEQTRTRPNQKIKNRSKATQIEATVKLTRKMQTSHRTNRTNKLRMSKKSSSMKRRNNRMKNQYETKAKQINHKSHSSGLWERKQKTMKKINPNCQVRLKKEARLKRKINKTITL